MILFFHFDRRHNYSSFKRKRLQILDSADSRGHLKVGVLRLGQGILNGVVGVVQQPLQGAYSEENSVKGFVKGVGKGLIGAAIKPLTGAADFASQTVRAFTVNNNRTIEALSPNTFGETRPARKSLFAESSSSDQEHIIVRQPSWSRRHLLDHSMPLLDNRRQRVSRAFSRRTADGQALLLRIMLAANGSIVLDEDEVSLLSLSNIIM